jgi:hypothetical protein
MLLSQFINMSGMMVGCHSIPSQSSNVTATHVTSTVEQYVIIKFLEEGLKIIRDLKHGMGNPACHGYMPE